MAEEQSRRDFMWTAGAAFGTAIYLVGVPEANAQGGPQQSCAPPKSLTPAVQFKPDTSAPIGVRRSAFEMDANAIAKLKLGYSKMRALTTSHPQDPRGWMQQAQVHCFNCSGGPVEIHNGWWFFPWHRAYLYFHATHPGEACRRSDADAAVLGRKYGQAQSAAAALHHAEQHIERTVRQELLADTELDHAGVNLFAEHLQSAARRADDEQIMGWPTDDPQFAGTGGSLEWGLHGTVHNWTGTQTNTAVDMGNLLTAARDPTSSRTTATSTGSGTCGRANRATRTIRSTSGSRIAGNSMTRTAC